MSSSELKDTISLDLSQLETLRKKTASHILKALVPYYFFILAIAGFICFHFVKIIASEYRVMYDIEVIYAGMLGVAMITFVVIFLLFRKTKKIYQKHLYNSEYAALYKKEVMASIVPQLGIQTVHQSEEGISLTSFHQSGFPLFRNPANYYSSNGINGSIGNTHFSFAEVLATQLNAGDYTSHELDLFRGMFFIIDFHKKAEWNTIVYPDYFKYFSKMLVGSWSEEDLFKQNNYRRVKLEDPEFEKIFQVYSTDQVESRYVLSPALMARMVDFNKKTKKIAQFSFKDSKAYLAIHYQNNKKLLAPPLFKTANNRKIIQTYSSDLQLMIDIINDLNLNSQLQSS